MEDLTTEQRIQMYEAEINDLKETIWNTKQEIKEFEQLLKKLRKNKNGKNSTN